MLSQEHQLSLKRQCQCLNLSRSGFYYQPAPESEQNLKLMRLIDEIHLKRAYLGVRRITDALRLMGHEINRKRVKRLMQRLHIRAIYPKPKTSKRNQAHKVYPYLLRDMVIDRPNQVWATDITYIPMAHGFLYLTVIMDWHSRKVLSWRLSNTLDTSFCIEALEEALGRYGTPDIFNSDQGVQFTSEAFTEALHKHNIRISMDGKGAWRDNVFVERLWRSVKYEEVYLNAYDSVAEAKLGIANWLTFYNTERKHQTLNCTPDELYQQGCAEVPDTGNSPIDEVIHKCTGHRKPSVFPDCEACVPCG